MNDKAPMVEVSGLSKSFVLHNQGCVRIDVLRGAHLSVARGECVALSGASGSGKSTLMRMIQGNYRADAGRILVDGTDVASADPREILSLRRNRMGYVSQFLRVVPRVPTRDVVAEPLLLNGSSPEAARIATDEMLARLNIPPRLWNLSPTTFSGGEQQRVNIARGLVHPYPVLLLDEPTASLDPVNREVVLDLLRKAKARGAAIIGIFHDAEARAQICDRQIDVAQFAPAA